ncbi:putative membrane protein [Croceifilum oryzae]|uniref:Membrane protein n=1 Tax=Croceifilum oryzae TaxID=1553429 RepID=A0AAJ1TP30_9BACL|nr:hypothetical protein [Croceifilum oryzae]MDQ0417991.1 putative membrane protein [Croceifilum oryzae]
MAAIQTFFSNAFIIVALFLGVLLAYQIVKDFGKRSFKETLILWGKFLLCVVIIAGIYDWISVGKKVSPSVADLLGDTIRYAIKSLKGVFIS